MYDNTVKQKILPIFDTSRAFFEYLHKTIEKKYGEAREWRAKRVRYFDISNMIIRSTESSIF